jgi:uncharacterized protein YodC (DUF2158 family)
MTTHKATIDVRDVVYLKSKDRVAKHDYMTVARVDGDVASCVWIDRFLSPEDGTFALHVLTRCDVPGRPAPSRSDLWPGSIVQLPSGDLGMEVRSVDDDGMVTCVWHGAGGRPCGADYPLGLLELIKLSP